MVSCSWFQFVTVQGMKPAVQCTCTLHTSEENFTSLARIQAEVRTTLRLVGLILTWYLVLPKFEVDHEVNGSDFLHQDLLLLCCLRTLFLHEAESIFQMNLKATTDMAKVSCSCEITP